MVGTNARILIFSILAVLLLANFAAGQVPQNYFGMMPHHPSTTNWPSVKFSTIRVYDNGAAWSTLNPAPGTYNWGPLDSWLNLAGAHGVDVLYTFGRTPKWAISGTCSGGYAPYGCAQPPASMTDWDDFVRAIATHAAGRIKYWEMWNEPNETAVSWAGGIPTLVTMTQHARAIIKSIDPNAVIVSPGTDKNTPTASYCNQVLGVNCGSNWTAAYLAAGAKGYVDVIAFHGYTGANPENVIGVIQLQKAAMAASGVASLPLWDTEGSWGMNTQLTSLSQRAAFVARKFLIERSSGISRLYWNSWDSATIGTLWSSTSGIQPAGTAYDQVSKWLTGATFTPCAMSSDSTWTCALTRAGGYQGLVIWNSAITKSYIFPPQFQQYRTLAGVVNPLTGSSVTIDPTPILLENLGTAPTPGPTPAPTPAPQPEPTPTPAPKADFSIAASPIINAQHGAYHVVVRPLTGRFDQPIIFSCVSSAKVRCSWSSTTVTPGGGAATSDLTVIQNSGTFAALTWAFLPFCATLFALPRFRCGGINFVPVILAVVLILAETNCIGLGTNPPSDTTPGATITVTVVGTSGSLQHSTELQMNMSRVSKGSGAGGNRRNAP
jgi:polysaccharide biosynthesis protein PslG